MEVRALHSLPGVTSITTNLDSAPTWPPQTTQQNWSDRRVRANFIKAWGGSSLSGHFSIARAMPRFYGARTQGIQRILRLGFSVRDNSSRIELGLPRRDPRSASPSCGHRAERACAHQHRSSRPRVEATAVLQGASATGGSTVTRRSPAMVRVTAERQPSGVMPRSTTFDFGVSVLARVAHANRACAATTLLASVAGAYAHNHRRDQQSRRCTLQNGLPAKSSAAHGVHG